MKQYDVVFIGSGHAAWHAALTLKHAGKDVAIIEKIRLQVHVQIMVVTPKSYLKDLTKCWKNQHNITVLFNHKTCM